MRDGDSNMGMKGEWKGGVKETFQLICVVTYTRRCRGGGCRNKIREGGWRLHGDDKE